jgi:hypothetical protein
MIPSGSILAAAALRALVLYSPAAFRAGKLYGCAYQSGTRNEVGRWLRSQYLAALCWATNSESLTSLPTGAAYITQHTATGTRTYCFCGFVTQNPC